MFENIRSVKKYIESEKLVMTTSSILITFFKSIFFSFFILNLINLIYALNNYSVSARTFILFRRLFLYANALFFYSLHSVDENYLSRKSRKSFQNSNRNIQFHLKSLQKSKQFTSANFKFWELFYIKTIVAI